MFCIDHHYRAKRIVPYKTEQNEAMFIFSWDQKVIIPSNAERQN